MILCIDKSALKVSKEVQKDIKLEELLLKHTKYFDGILRAYEENYVPLDFCTSVRSMYSNLVLSHENEDGNKLLYTNLSLIHETPHSGYDLVMYLASVALTKRVTSLTGICDIMMKHSQIQPIGLLNLNHSVMNPMVYSHIILSDEGAELIKKYLNNGSEFVSLDDLDQYRKKGNNITALLDTFIKVRKEDENEQ